MHSKAFLTHLPPPNANESISPLMKNMLSPVHLYTCCRHKRVSLKAAHSVDICQHCRSCRFIPTFIFRIKVPACGTHELMNDKCGPEAPLSASQPPLTDVWLNIVNICRAELVTGAWTAPIPGESSRSYKTLNTWKNFNKLLYLLTSNIGGIYLKLWVKGE